MSTPADITPEVLEELYKYSACDISDALLKLKVPEAGFLPDLTPYTAPQHKNSSNPRKVTVARASTMLFIPKDDDGLAYPSGNIPLDKHWVDLTTPGTIVVASQPDGQRNAVLGGIMAARMKKLGVKGVVVKGRIRDLEELKLMNLTIWAKGTSTVGQGLATKAHAHNIPITVSGITISPNDIVFSDPTSGVVIIPASKFSQVLELLPQLVQADERVMEDVENGLNVKDAFKKHRSGL